MGPIAAEDCIGGIELSEPRLSPDGAMLAYVRSTVGGSALMISGLDGSLPRQLTTYPAPSSGRGLGGGCWCWCPDSAAVIYAAADGLWMQPVPGGQLRRLTSNSPDAPARAPMVTPDGTSVVYVVDQREVWLQPLDADPASGGLRRLDDGSADFCFDPYVTPDGADVMWQAWNVPDMAWDAARLERVGIDGARRRTIVVSGAIQQPRTLPDGSLVCTRDDTGWNNVWVDGRPLVDEPYEHAAPTWGLGQRTFAPSPDGRLLAFTRNVAGFGQLCVVDTQTGQIRDVARAVHGQLSWHGTRVAALRTGARTPPQVVVYDDSTWERTVIDVGSVSGWKVEDLVEPELVEIESRDGATIHARLFRAEQQTSRLICWLHGGPTDQWMVTFMPRLAYWRSRGFNVLVPDHRGSSGHGRAYQQAMNGRWGDLDVADTIDAIAHAHASGWGAAAQTVLMGGSAGGFTVLGVLGGQPLLAAAAVVSYPVTDLFDLAQSSHRFEAHYTHHLVAPIPAMCPDAGPYVDRSPVTFADRIRTPLLIFHGDTDPVVPVEQSRTFAARIEAAGGSVELHVYEGEGHGFRRPENQLDEYRRTGEFLAARIGFGP